MPKNRKPPAEVFLNIPYDRRFQNLFLAYVAGVSAFGLIPRATLEIPSSSRRLEKIIRLLRSCRFSLHDLSRVELDTQSPRTPRFNMPFELGLAVAHQQTAQGRKHHWFVCEAKNRRLQKSLSDLNGTDPYIHGGTIRGLFRELCNIFSRPNRRPTTQQMQRIYRGMKRNLPTILYQSGAHSLFTARVFNDLCVVASSYAAKFVR